jgi:hypothetical protein
MFLLVVVASLGTAIVLSIWLPTLVVVFALGIGPLLLLATWVVGGRAWDVVGPGPRPSAAERERAERRGIRIAVIAAVAGALLVGILTPIGGLSEADVSKKIEDAARELNKAERLTGPAAAGAVSAAQARLRQAAGERPSKLPAVALESRVLFRTELALASFYAFLLLFVPLVYGLKGELPIELTRGGFRYPEKVAETSNEVLTELKGWVVEQQNDIAIASALVKGSLERIGSLESELGDVNAETHRDEVEDV